jgi:hypothetical protein
LGTRDYSVRSSSGAFIDQDSLRSGEFGRFPDAEIARNGMARNKGQSSPRGNQPPGGRDVPLWSRCEADERLPSQPPELRTKHFRSRLLLNNNLELFHPHSHRNRLPPCDGRLHTLTRFSTQAPKTAADMTVCRFYQQGYCKFGSTKAAVPFQNNHNSSSSPLAPSDSGRSVSTARNPPI